MAEIKVRALLVSDVFTVARMLSKVTKGARGELVLALKAEKEDKPDPTELGMVLFQNLFIEAEEDLKAWLADLIGKTKIEFETMPAIAVIDTVKVLIRQEDIVDFFGQVSQLVSRMEKSISTNSST